MDTFKVIPVKGGEHTGTWTVLHYQDEDCRGGDFHWLTLEHAEQAADAYRNGLVIHGLATASQVLTAHSRAEMTWMVPTLNEANPKGNSTFHPLNLPGTTEAFVATADECDVASDWALQIFNTFGGTLETLSDFADGPQSSFMAGFLVARRLFMSERAPS